MADPADLPGALGRYATAEPFGVLAHEFFARFLTRFIDYHLSKTLPLHVGDGRRFDGSGAGRADFPARVKGPAGRGESPP